MSGNVKSAHFYISVSFCLCVWECFLLNMFFLKYVIFLQRNDQAQRR